MSHRSEGASQAGPDPAILFDAASGELRAGSRSSTLRPRTASVMATLIAAPGELVTKERLLAAAWPDSIVTDDSLTQCIKEIRKALGPAAGRIRTVPRRGYIFLSEAANKAKPVRRFTAIALAMLVLVAALLSALPWWRSMATAAPAPSSVLVLPFSASPDVPSWLGDSLSDALIDDLARLPQARVIARGTSDSFRGSSVGAIEAGKALGVAYVVQGHLHQDGDATQLTVRMLDTRQGFQHWSEQIKVPRAALVDVQRRLAVRITRTLEVELIEADLALATKGFLALEGPQELTLQGWASLNRGSRDEVLRARSLFEQAVNSDPRDSRAWLGLSHTYITSHVLRWPGSQADGDLGKAADSLARAQSLAPRQLYMNGTAGTVQALRGKLDEARGLLETEVSHYPSNATAQYWLGIVLIYLNDGAPAEAALQRAIELSPRDKAISGFRRAKAMALILQGRNQEAVDEARKAVASGQPHRLSYATLAVALHENGKMREAAEAMAEFLRQNPGYTLDKLIGEEFTQDPEFLARKKWVYDAMLAAGLPPGEACKQNGLQCANTASR